MKSFLPRVFKLGSKNMESSWIITLGSKKRGWIINFLVDLSWGIPVNIKMWGRKPSELLSLQILIAMLKYPPPKKKGSLK